MIQCGCRKDNVTIITLLRYYGINKWDDHIILVEEGKNGIVTEK